MRAELARLRKMGIEPIPNYTPVIADNGGPCLYDKVAETFHLEQKKIRNRLLVTIPLLAAGGFLTWYSLSNEQGFQTVWRYFSWSNQTLAMISLWVATAYLLKEGKHRTASLLTAVPAAFMSAVSLTYILMAGEGFGLSRAIAYPAGIGFAAVMFLLYAVFSIRMQRDAGGPGKSAR